MDEVWCLLDVEAPQNHPRLADAIGLAERNRVHLAFSNPCFEAWLLLHDRDLGGYLTTAEAVSAAQALTGVNGKQLDAFELVERRGVAAARAQTLRGRHERNDVAFPGDNPSSQIDLFVAAIEQQ